MLLGQVMLSTMCSLLAATTAVHFLQQHFAVCAVCPSNIQMACMQTVNVIAVTSLVSMQEQVGHHAD